MELNKIYNEDCLEVALIIHLVVMASEDDK